MKRRKSVDLVTQIIKNPREPVCYMKTIDFGDCLPIKKLADRYEKFMNQSQSVTL